MASFPLAMVSSNTKSIVTLHDDGELPLEIYKPVSVSNIEAGVAREAALVRRIDWNLIPIMMVLYLFSFLDRGKLLGVRKRVLCISTNLHSEHWQCQALWIAS
jgi:hypothetical protein